MRTKILLASISGLGLVIAVASLLVMHPRIANAQYSDPYARPTPPYVYVERVDGLSVIGSGSLHVQGIQVVGFSCIADTDGSPHCFVASKK